WAPLPPGVSLAAAGLTFHHRRITADFDLGLPAGWFTFVSQDNFLSRNLHSCAIPASQAAGIYTRSVAVNNYSIANQKILNLGPGRPRLAAAEAGPAPSLGNKIPARERRLAADPQVAPQYDPQPLVSWVAREEAASAPPRRSLGLPALPLP